MATPATIKPEKRSGLLQLIAVVCGVLLFSACVFVYFRPVLFLSGLERVAEWKMGLANRDVQLGPYRIHYLVGGKGKPLVLVHGLAGKAEDWLTLVPPLKAAGYRIYALDLLGYGKSDTPDVDYSIALQAEIVRQFMDSQKLEQPDLAGWSMGGWVAGKFAADHPERVHRLILLDSAGMRFDAVNASALRPKTEADLARMLQVLTPHPRHIPGFYARDLLRHLAAEDWIIDRSLKSMFTGKDLLDGKLGAVKSPVLMVWGKDDVLTPPVIGEKMHQEMPQSVFYLIDGCGHLAPVECSKSTGREMVKFLTADPPLAPARQEIGKE